MANELPAISQGIKELVSSMKGHVQKLGSTIGSHFSEVMSEEMKMVNDTLKSGFTFAKDTTMKTLAFFGKSFGIDWKTLKIQISQLKMLRLITGQMERTEKSRLARFKGRSKDFLKALLELLGLSLVAIGAAAGAILGKFLLPFTLLAKTLKKLLPIGKALKALAKAGPIAKLIKSFGWLGRIFTFFGKLWGIRHVLRGLKFGFAKLVWPLQIILSAIDFVSGFMETEGTILDKIKGGIKNVIVKFLEWPALMLGKLWDWLLIDVLKIKPEEERGKAGLAIVKGIGDLIDAYFKFFDMAFKPIKDALGCLVDLLKNLDYKAAVEWITDIKNKLEGFPAALKKWFLDLPGIKFLTESYDKYFKTPKIKYDDETIKKHNEWVDNKIKSSGYGDLYKKSIEQRDKTNKLLEENNKLQQEIIEKGGGVVVTPQQRSQPTMDIPTTVGDPGIDGAMGEMVRGKITPR